MKNILAPITRFTALVRMAFSDTEQDFTRGSLRRAVILLAIPMVLEMGMESVFAITDIFWVAQLGAEAVAGVGLTEAVMTLVYAVAVGLGMGVTALVARRVGEGDDDGAAAVAGQTLWLGLLASLGVASLGLSFAPEILVLMGADGAVVEQASMYTRLMLGGSATVVYIFLLNAAFRGAGVPAVAMRALVLANSINLVLDPCLIFGLGPLPALGVTGAAVATNIGRAVGVFYLLVRLHQGQAHLRLSARHLAFDGAVMRRLVVVSLGGIAQFLVATASWVLLMRLMARYGGEAIAGYAIAIRLIDFTLLPAWGLSNAAATLVGQNLGAGSVSRAKRAVRIVMTYTVAFTVLVATVFVAHGEALVALFSAAPAIVSYGGECLRYVGYGYGFFAVGLVLTQAFNGAGDTYTPTWINFICFWLLQLPLAWWLAEGRALGPHGVFVSMTLAEAAIAALAWWVYRRDRWSQVSV